MVEIAGTGHTWESPGRARSSSGDLCSLPRKPRWSPGLCGQTGLGRVQRVKGALKQEERSPSSEDGVLEDLEPPASLFIYKEAGRNSSISHQAPNPG